MEAEMNAFKAVMAAAITASAAHAAPARAQMRPDPMYTMAMSHYSAGRFGEAATALRESASRGNALAAETLGFMLYFGDQMYAGSIATNRQQGLRWLLVAAQGGRERAQQFVQQPEVRSVARSVMVSSK
jgi:TPR repeat protein